MKPWVQSSVLKKKKKKSQQKKIDIKKAIKFVGKNVKAVRNKNNLLKLVKQ
jgi:hypothetical protein